MAHPRHLPFLTTNPAKNPGHRELGRVGWLIQIMQVPFPPSPRPLILLRLLDGRGQVGTGQCVTLSERPPWLETSRLTSTA
jgi:hypothetical protein